MRMLPRALPLLAALLLGVAAAVLVACGAGPERGIPRGDADQLVADLDALRNAVESGDCEAAAAAVTKVKGDVVELPGAVNARLRRRLANGADNLARRATTECARNQQTTTTETTPTTTTPTETTPTETTPTETTPTTTDTTPTQTTPTTPTQTTPTTSTPTTTTPTSPTTPGGSGGASPGTGTSTSRGGGSTDSGGMTEPTP
jgi:hypothetical protein